MSRSRALSVQTKNVLSALLEQGSRGAHGYEIMHRVGIKSGTLYPILIRLADQQFVEAEWQESRVPGRPPRQVYRLTASGLELARRYSREPEVGIDPSTGTAPA